jgi:hypothetical protein
MKTAEIKDRLNRRNEALKQKFTVSNGKSIRPKTETEYAILKQFRIKLGKSKAEFLKIFDLYKHLLGQKNP